MRLIVVGPGRAGTALALAASTAGHRIVAVAGRDPEATSSAASAVGADALDIADAMPEADLVVVAVRDDAIGEVASSIAATAAVAAPGAVHLSGAVPVSALAPLADAGLAIGSFHPLQTLPDAASGAARLAGAWAAITATGALHDRLVELAGSIGMRHFDLDDDRKAVYHAAAAAAANFPLAALIMAESLFAAAGVPFAAARPLVEAVVANAFDLGPRASLTGPVARGDAGTVESQIHAVSERAPALADDFRTLVVVLARIAGAVEIEERWS